MPPFKMRDMPEERKQNFIALKQEVKISELIPVLMKEAPETAATTLSRTLDLYEKGQLRGRMCRALRHDSSSRRVPSATPGR